MAIYNINIDNRVGALIVIVLSVIAIELVAPGTVQSTIDGVMNWISGVEVETPGGSL